MKRLLFLLLSLSLGLNAGLLFVRYVDKQLPGPLPGGPPPQQIHRPPPPPKVMIQQQLAAKTRHLGLSLDQQDAIRKILEKHLPAMAELRDRASMANRRMTEVYADESFEKVEFQRLMREAGLARAQADSISAVILMEEAAVLNEEQRRMFAEVAPMSHTQEHRPPPRGGRRPR